MALDSTEHRSELLGVVEQIYAAAAGELRLEDAFESFTTLMGDYATAVFGHDPVLGESTMEAVVGVERSWLEEYNRRWGASNPLMARGIGDLMAGRIVNSEALIPWHELQQTDYYREFLAPMGCRYSLGAMVTGKAQRHASLVTARREAAGPYTARHFAHVDAIRRHLARALHILEFFDGQGLWIDTYRATIDRMPFSVLLLDDEARIVHANARARQRLSDGDALQERKGVLASIDGGRSALAAQWRALVSDPLLAECRLAARFGGARSVLNAELSRLDVRGTGHPGRIWMLRFHDAQLDAEVLSALWRSSYALTEAECRTAQALLRHGSTRAAAAQLGRSENTVREHLKHMFVKTATSNQAALTVKLMSVAAPTLR